LAVILYSPWGAGGNLVRNIASLDMRYDFFDGGRVLQEYPTEVSRFHCMEQYYSNKVTNDTWSTREADLRKKFIGKYYERNLIAYWDSNNKTVYECHGDEEEINNILNGKSLDIYDRTRVNAGKLEENPSPWSLLDCHHVFLMPKNLKLITDLYHCKNPSTPLLHPNTSVSSKKQQLYMLNRLMQLRLESLAKTLEAQGRAVYKYTADDLFADSGYNLINQIFIDTGICVTEHHVKSLHQIWLQDTRELYKNFYSRELP